MTDQRQTFSSRFSFIMAQVGFAIGLGNLWRFPYLVGTEGGGAFVIIYLIICALIGLPLFTMEITLGRRAKSSPIKGMQKLEGKSSPWTLFGWFSVLAAFVILTYYIQLMGWLLYYVSQSVIGGLSGLSGAGHQAVFDGFTTSSATVLIFALICTVLIAIIQNKGLSGGIEKVCNTVLPVLFIMLIVLAIRSITLPGAIEGVKWYLRPDFSAVSGDTFLKALGQCFFSIGIASGGGFIYGSYLEEDSNIPKDGAMVIGMDTLAAILAGLVMFPAIFSMGLEVNQGPQLLFVTMSNVFDSMPGGRIFGTIFYSLVLLAALTSTIGYLEPVVTSFEDLKGFDRKKATNISLILITILSIPTILSHGIWSDISVFGMNFFDFADFLSGNILMPLGAITISLYVIFKWKFENFQTEANLNTGAFRVWDSWKILVYLVVPISLIIIFVTGVFF